jgi:hypothetical protein
MMAIALAGGSVAACSEAVGPVDVEGTAPAPADDHAARGSATPPALMVTPAIDTAVVPASDPPPRGYTIPRCNANPDPCCREPDLPECQARDAGGGDAGGGGDEPDAGEAEAGCDGAPGAPSSP